MKYMLLFYGSASNDQVRDDLAELEQRVYDWIGTFRSRIESNGRLAPARLAKAVTQGGSDRAVVTDGPYTESSEVVGGYAVVEATDLDEATEMAKKWPAGPVEIRQLI